jgi:hydrogenase maturation factor
MASTKKSKNNLGLGKVSQEVMNRSVIPYLPMSETLQLDGGSFNSQGKVVVAHSPSIGVPLESLGHFAFHYAASNVACRFARPKYLVVGLYLPVGSEENNLKVISKSLGEEAKKYGVTVVAGQTATYYGIEVPFVTTTCLGESIGNPMVPTQGDEILLIGEIGGEASWLRDSSRGLATKEWKKFTPLNIIVKLQRIEGVTLIHDVSEGGVKRALLEVSEALQMMLDVNSEKIVFANGVLKIEEDPLRLPTYGTVIVLIRPEARDTITAICRENMFPCMNVGAVKAGEGVFIDGKKLEPPERIAFDNIYGSFKKSS